MTYEGYATGWFVVGHSDEIEVGKVKELKYFGQHLAAFRDEQGKLQVIDAMCPHLGANMCHGGKLVDSTLQCPFHAWRFDGAGKCVEVPYATKQPKRADVKAWPAEEVNGLMFVWHDRHDRAPFWHIPTIDVFGEEDWMPWTRSVIHVKTHPREIVENVADKAHFPTVHGTHVDFFENEYVEHRAIQRTAGIAYPRGGGKDKFSLTATYYGPGYQVTEMKSFLDNRLFLSHTPIDEHSLDLRFGVMLKIVGDAAKTQGFCDKYAENLETGFHEDIQIWEHKVWRDRPVLCDGDGPIPKLRRWYRQFYEDAA